MEIYFTKDDIYSRVFISMQIDSGNSALEFFSKKLTRQDVKGAEF